MPFVRVSTVNPKPASEPEVRRIMQELMNYMAQQEGYLGGYYLESLGTGLLGRVTLWQEEAHADHTAQTDHVMALRSQLNLLVEPGSHEEHAFEGISVPPVK